MKATLNKFLKYRKKVKLKMNNKKNMAVNTANATEIPLLNEPLTFALVLRGLPKEIQALKVFLEQSPLTVVYKHISYGKLYISDHKGVLNGKD